MTRKRFIKLIMSSGWSRNRANGLADTAVREGIDYSEALKCFEMSITMCRVNIAPFIVAMRTINNTISSALDSIRSMGLNTVISRNREG